MLRELLVFLGLCPSMLVVLVSSLPSILSLALHIQTPSSFTDIIYYLSLDPIKILEKIPVSIWVGGVTSNSCLSPFAKLDWLIMCFIYLDYILVLRSRRSFFDPGYPCASAVWVSRNFTTGLL
jgi:hypothetical protein